jgi:hypothetical protein
MDGGRNVRDTFHAKLDRDCDEKRKQLENKLIELESERKQGHEWIESAPESVLRSLADGATFQVSGGDKVPISEVRRISLYEPVKSIIESIDPQHEITSAIIYDALLQALPSLEYENEWKLKARIAATLGRLADEKVLKVKKAGRGSAPHVYVRRNPPYKSVMDALNQGAKITK